MLKINLFISLLVGILTISIILGLIPTLPTLPNEDENQISKSITPKIKYLTPVQSQERSPLQDGTRLNISAINTNNQTKFFLDESITIEGWLGLEYSGTDYGYGQKYVYAYWNSTNLDGTQRLKSDSGAEYWTTNGSNIHNPSVYGSKGGWYSVSFTLDRDGTAFSRIKSQGTGLQLGEVTITIAVFSYSENNTGVNTEEEWNATTYSFKVWGKGEITSTNVNPDPILRTQNGTFIIRTRDKQDTSLRINGVPISIYEVDGGAVGDASFRVIPQSGDTDGNGELAIEISTNTTTTVGGHTIVFAADFTANGSDYYEGLLPGNTSTVTVSFSVIAAATLTATVTATSHDAALAGIVAANDTTAVEPGAGVFFEVFPGYTTITIEGDYRDDNATLITAPLSIDAYCQLHDDPDNSSRYTIPGSNTTLTNGFYSITVPIPSSITNNAELRGNDIEVFVMFTGGDSGNFTPWFYTNDTIRLVGLTTINNFQVQSEVGVSSSADDTVFVYEGEDVTITGTLQDEWGHNLPTRDLDWIINGTYDPATVTATNGDIANTITISNYGSPAADRAALIEIDFAEEAHYRGISESIRVLIYNQSIIFQDLTIEWEINDQMNPLKRDSIVLTPLNNDTSISVENVTAVHILNTLEIRDNSDRTLRDRTAQNDYCIQISFRDQTLGTNFQDYTNPLGANVTHGDILNTWITDWPVTALLVVRVISAEDTEISRLQFTIEIDKVLDETTPTITFQNLFWYNQTIGQYVTLPDVDAQTVNGTIRFTIEVDDNDTQAITSTNIGSVQITLTVAGRAPVPLTAQTVDYIGTYNEIATYNFTLDTTTIYNDDDYYTVNITASDGAGNTATITTYTIKINNLDTVSPQASILSIGGQNPADIPIVTGTDVIIQINADDTDGIFDRTGLAGIDYVQLFINNESRLATELTPTEYEYVITSTRDLAETLGLNGGRGGNDPINLTLIVYDLSGNNHSVQEQFRIKNDLDDPTIENVMLEGNKTALISGWDINGTVTITVNATDPDPPSASNISHIQISFSTTNFSYSTNMTYSATIDVFEFYNFEWDTGASSPINGAELEDETLTIKITAYDNTGRSSVEESIIVVVNNQLPPVTTTEISTTTTDLTVTIITETTIINGSVIVITKTTVPGGDGGGTDIFLFIIADILALGVGVSIAFAYERFIKR